MTVFPLNPYVGYEQFTHICSSFYHFPDVTCMKRLKGTNTPNSNVFFSFKFLMKKILPGDDICWTIIQFILLRRQPMFTCCGPIMLTPVYHFIIHLDFTFYLKILFLSSIQWNVDDTFVTLFCFRQCTLIEMMQLFLASTSTLKNYQMRKDVMLKN